MSWFSRLFGCDEKLNLVCDGDSRTYGWTRIPGNTGYAMEDYEVSSPTYPQQLALDCNVTRVANLGVAGATTAQILQHPIPTPISGYRNLLIEWGCVNDILTGVSIATSRANIAAYLQSRHAAGWEVAFMNEPPCAYENPDMPWSSADEAWRREWNAWLPSITSSVIDLSSLGDPAIWSSDGLHPTPSGYATIGNLAARWVKK
jgi:lysophospholipase L1-like esterase